MPTLEEIETLLAGGDPNARLVDLSIYAEGGPVSAQRPT